MIKLFNGDCLECMKMLDDKSVDMILCDLPYGTTACEWDTRIPFEPLWEQYERIIKDNGAIVLFSQMPFGAELIQSNRKLFRYEWIWDKVSKGGYLNAKKMPMRRHENVLVFYKKRPTYNAQMIDGEPYVRYRRARLNAIYDTAVTPVTICKDGKRYPSDIITFANSDHSDKTHPTQKPVALLEYLIKTYTNEGDIVLDNCMGSGSTGVACVHTNRQFIGMELDTRYFEIASKRINEA